MTFAADFSVNIVALKAILIAAEAQIGEQNKTINERDGLIERKEDRTARASLSTIAISSARLPKKHH